MQTYDSQAKPRSLRALRSASLAALAVAFLMAGPVASSAQVFREEFDGSEVDTNTWVVDPGGGEITVTGGRLFLHGPSGSYQFPYLTTRANPFPTSGDLLIRVRFRYPNVSSGGNGFGAWPSGTTGRGFHVWQGYPGGLSVAIGDLYPVVVFPSSNYDWHTYEWQYIGGVYDFYLDGVLFGSDPSDFRPTMLFLGHAPYTYHSWTWQETDYVHIEATSPTAVAEGSWGRLKLLYR